MTERLDWEKDFPFRIEDGVLEIWKRTLPEGDWEGRTASVEDIKKYVRRVRKEAMREAIERFDKDEKGMGEEAGE